MSNWLLYIAGLFSLALAALFAVPNFIDWNGYRGVFEEEATRILGREVRVGGDVNVRFLPSPYVSFEKLRIADPSGSTGEPFFRADSFTMRLSAPPLLKGIIEANEIVLEKPVLRLAVDAEGSGNWRSFSIAEGSLPFVPAGVSLQSLKIVDGVIAFHGPKGIGFAELDGLNGELKAESIDGPFAFKGITKYKGADRDVRISTGPREADGGIRFKAMVRGTTGATSIYTVDGRLDDLKGRPRVSGELTAKLALAEGDVPGAAAPVAVPPPVIPAFAPTTTPGAGTAGTNTPGTSTPGTSAPVAAPVAGEKAAVPLIDFKSRISGDAKGLRLDDIAVSFQHVGQPQLISGSATATWTEALNVEMSLASRWLDLDRVAKLQEGAGSPFETARNFILAMMEALPKNADSKVNFDLDQASLGGEAVSGIKLEVARAQGVLLLSNLRAGLPGGSKLALDGAVADAATGQAFRGDLTLHGTSLARFLDWAAKDKALAESVRSEGPFSLQGRLAMSENGIALTEAGAEIAGRPITGEVHYSMKDRRRLAIVLEGSEIDAAQLWPTGVSALKRVLAGTNPEAAAAEKPSQFAWLDTTTTDLHLRLRTGELITDRGKLRDVDLDVGVEQGRLMMRACKFVAADGLQLEIEGNVADATKSPRGSLQWVFGAPSKEAYATLVQMFDLPDAVRAQADAFAALAPMRIAGTVRLGERQAGAADIAADGSVQSNGRLVASALLDGGLGNWRRAAADITATIDSPDVSPVVIGLGSRSGSAPTIATAPQAGEIFLKAVGTPVKGMTTSASAKAPALFVGYDGRVVLPDDGGRVLDGDLRVSASGLSDVMAVAGLGSGAALSETPIVGTIKLGSADRAIELKPLQLTIGGSRIGGSVALSYPSEGPAIVTGQVEVDSATVSGLLGLALDRKQVAEAPGAEPLAAGRTIWPEHAFDFAALDGIEGKLDVGFGSLVLTDGMAVANARAQIALAPGKITVSKLEGKVLGGELVSNVALERAPGGANLAGDLSISDMHINRPRRRRLADRRPAEGCGGFADTRILRPRFDPRRTGLGRHRQGRAEARRDLHACADAARRGGDVRRRAVGPGRRQRRAARHRAARADRRQRGAGGSAHHPDRDCRRSRQAGARHAQLRRRHDQGRDDHRSRLAGGRQRLARRTEGARCRAGRQAARRRTAERRHRLHRPARQCVGAGIAHHRRAAGARARHPQDGARRRSARAPAQRGRRARPPRRRAAPCARSRSGQHRTGTRRAGSRAGRTARAAAIRQRCRSIRPRRTAGRRGRACHSAEQRQRARRAGAAGSRRSASCRAGRRRSDDRRRSNGRG